MLTGPNASGKTSTIEAIHSVCTGTSFRKRTWADVVRFGAHEAIVTIRAEGESPSLSARMTVRRDGRKSWTVGSERGRSIGTSRSIPSVVFTPDDLMIVKGPAEQRRNTIDAFGEQLSPVYRSLRKDYSRVVRQRNALLKDNASRVALEPWDGQLAILGAKLHIHRRGLLSKLAVELTRTYRDLSCRDEVLSVSMTDECGIGPVSLDETIDQDVVADSIRDRISARWNEERERGVSLVGPHRDDIVFRIDGVEARSFASQGQLRTIALAWKLAEVEVVTNVLSRKPVLLLDDVMSELDEQRRAALVRVIQDDIQTFVTSTDTSCFSHWSIDPALVVPIGDLT